MNDTLDEQIQYIRRQEPYHDDPQWHAFLVAMLAEPENPAHRLICADWLEDQGFSRRARLIRIGEEILALGKVPTTINVPRRDISVINSDSYRINLRTQPASPLVIGERVSLAIMDSIQRGGVEVFAQEHILRNLVVERVEILMDTEIFMNESRPIHSHVTLVRDPNPFDGRRCTELLKEGCALRGTDLATKSIAHTTAFEAFTSVFSGSMNDLLTHGADLVKLEPFRRFECTNKIPGDRTGIYYPYRLPSTGPYFWECGTHDSDHALPPHVYNKILHITRHTTAVFETRGEAIAMLGRALLAMARKKSGLPFPRQLLQ